MTPLCYKHEQLKHYLLNVNQNAKMFRKDLKNHESKQIPLCSKTRLKIETESK